MLNYYNDPAHVAAKPKETELHKRKDILIWIGKALVVLSKTSVSWIANLVKQGVKFEGGNLR